MSDLRQRRRATTRTQIVESLLARLETNPPATISMASVAEAAGVSLRTLYRYFPTKADLLDAAGSWFNEQLEADADGRGVTAENFAAYQRELWTDFADNLPAVKAQHLSSAGKELRSHRLARHRRAVGTVVDGLAGDLDPGDRRRLIDACIAAGSSATFLELVDRMDHEAGDAADLSVWMVEALLAHAQRTGTTHPSDHDQEAP